MSIGTNDLAQYTLAADRMAGELADLLDPWQPALLDLIRMTAQAGIEAGKPVGVCGEAAASPTLAPVLVGLGVTSLSMASTAVADVREALAVLTLADCQALAQEALRASVARSTGEPGTRGVRAATVGLADDRFDRHRSAHPLHGRRPRASDPGCHPAQPAPT